MSRSSSPATNKFRSISKDETPLMGNRAVTPTMPLPPTHIIIIIIMVRNV
jgi:hypothetical protein